MNNKIDFDKIDWSEIQEEALELFRKLVQVDTSNPPGNETQAAKILQEYLARYGIESSLIEAEPGRGNLVARLKGGVGESLMLDAHLDVVPAGRGWKYEPFEAKVADGFVWGRGTLDMKHMAAMSAACLAAIKRLNLKLTGDLIFVASADEERSGKRGAEFLVNKYPDLVRADYTIGEAGGMTIWLDDLRIYPIQVAQKGICWFKVTVTGQGGHGSFHHPHSTSLNLADAIKRISTMRCPIKPTPVANEFFIQLAQVLGGLRGKVVKMCTNPLLGQLVLNYLIPQKQRPVFKAMLANVVNVTLVRSGDAPNMVPTEAVFHVDCRILPGVRCQEMKELITNAVGKNGKVELLECKPPLVNSWNNRLFKVIRETVAELDPGAKTVPFLMSGYTNGSAYARLGTKYYGFTPLLLPRGFDAASLFHAPNERCPVDGFKWGVRALLQTVVKFLSTN